MPSIFDRQRLTPTQLRTVAERRFRDAMCLLRSGDNERANGAMYLAGFVIECLLKAKLLEAHPWLQNAGSPRGRDQADRRLWSLCYRSHDLSEILVRLPALQHHLRNAERRGHARLFKALNLICGEWTIFARYSPRSADIEDARDLVGRVKDIRTWLK